MTAERTSRGAAWAASIVLIGALVVASRASAQSCAMLPPGQPPEGAPAPAAMQREAVDAAMTGLSAQGATVIPSDDARRRMIGEPFAECRDLDCGPDVVQNLGVDFVVLVTVWAPRGTATSVVVTLVGAHDSVAGDSPVANGDVSAAATAALATALSRWQASQTGFVVVTSEPPGASVEVDGRAVGRTPLRYLVPAGQRTLRIYMDGFVAVERVLDVTSAQEHPIEVTLVAEGAIEGPQEPPTRTEPHFLNWIVGGALVAGGVAALIAPIHTLARDGECTEPLGTAFCRSRVEFGAVSGVLLGVGALAIVGGVIFFAAQPITVTVAASPDAAQMRLSGRF